MRGKLVVVRGDGVVHGPERRFVGVVLLRKLDGCQGIRTWHARTFQTKTQRQVERL